MEPLLRRALEARDDDAPRLVWADAVGGERGALVQVQCALSGRRHSIVERRKLQIHQRQLLRLFGWKWSGLDGLATSCRFHRGFVVSATVSLKVAMEQGEALFERAPFLRALSIVGSAEMTRSMFAELLRSPLLSRVEQLWLPTGRDIVPIDNPAGVGLRYWEAEASELVLRSGVLSRLRVFGMERGLRESGVNRLVESGALDHLEGLSLSELTCSSWLPRFQRLRSLRVNGSNEHLAELPGSLEVLGISAGRDGLEIVARSPAAKSLVALDLHAGLDCIRQLHRFPSLRSLSLSMAIDKSDRDERRQALAALVEQPLDSLEELEVTNELEVDDVRMLVERFGRQLHLLTLPDAWRALRDTASYEKMTGELRLYVLGHGAPPEIVRTPHDSFLDHLVLVPPPAPQSE